MTLRHHASLTVDGKQAQKELAKTTQAVDALGKEFTETGAKAGNAKSQLTSVSSQAKTAAPTFNTAAGSVGNLTSQFNDIGVMLAAGQNPLQLAIQQGTQIGQVFQQSGAKGKDAAKLIASGFAAMLSPVNLLTIGSIALGGALVNWMTRSEDKVADVTGELKAARQAAIEAAREIKRIEYGAGDDNELVFIEQVEQARRRLATAQGQLQNGRAVEQARIEVELAEKALAAAEEELQVFQQKQEKLQSLSSLHDRIAGLMSGQLEKAAQVLVARQSILADLREEAEIQSLTLRYGEDSWEVTEARQEAERRAFAELLKSEGIAGALAEELWEAFDNVQRLSRVDIAGGIWGAADAASQLAANLSNAAAQKAALASISSSQQSAARSQIMLDTVGQPVERAGRLAVQDFRNNVPDGGYDLISSGSAGRVGALGSVEGTIQAEAENAARLEEAARNADAEYRKLQTSLTKGSGGRRGGRSSSRQERDDVAELLGDYEQRLAILRETDPVQQQLLRHSDALKNATQAQVEAVREKINVLQSEEATQERIKSLQDFGGSLVMDGLDAMRQKGDAAAQAWQRVADRILDAVMQAAILGDGPMGGLFGGGLMGLVTGGGGGGIFGLVGKLFGFADGGDLGLAYGAGGSRDDLMVARSPSGHLFRRSPGEFMVNADATAKHRGLLEALNAGAPLPRFAQGGALNGSFASGQPASMRVELVDASQRGLSVRQLDDGVDGQGNRHPRFELADAVGTAMTTRGGKAQRFLRGQGIREMGPSR